MMTRPAKCSERVAVIHADEEATKFKVIHLPRKSSTDLLLAVCGKVVLELSSFNPSNAAWMAGNKLVPDGAMHTMTPVDPLLLVLPEFPSCTTEGFSSSCFCELEELLNQNLPAEYQFLLDIVDVDQMANLCDTKHMGGDVYFRFSFDRIVAWLGCKALGAVEAVRATCCSALPPGPQSELRYAVGLLAEYLSPAWAGHLVAALGLQDVPVVAQKRVLAEVQPSEPLHGAPPPVAEQQKKEADLSGKEKAAQSREASKLKARAKAAKGSAAISSFFGGKK